MKRIRLAFSYSTVGVFFFGIALAAMAFFGLESQDEHNFIDRMLVKIESSTDLSDPTRQDDEFIKNSVHFTHYLLQRRTEIFRATSGDLPIKERMFHSPIRASIDGYGDCGGYSVFLMSLLSRRGYNVKSCQMKVNGLYGGHVTVAVQLPGRLVVVDPLYNETFEDANGRLSDIRTVSEHWSYYRARIANQDYRDEYDYSNGYRFTNWDKFGPVSRAAQTSLAFIGGDQWVNTLSLRRYFLDTYQLGFMLAAIYVTLFLLFNMKKILTALRNRYLSDFKFGFPKSRQQVFRHSEAA